MEVDYYARWGWSQGRGLEPLSEQKAAKIHARGRSYVAHLVEARLVVTLRPEAGYVALKFLGADGGALAGLALVMDGGTRIESIDVQRHGEEIVRLQGGHGPELTVTTAPFAAPTEFATKPLPDLRFPAFGELGDLVELPRDPWAFVELPPGFEPPQPAS